MGNLWLLIFFIIGVKQREAIHGVTALIWLTLQSLTNMNSSNKWLFQEISAKDQLYSWLISQCILYGAKGITIKGVGETVVKFNMEVWALSTMTPQK